MTNFLKAGTLFLIILLVAVLAILTREEEDPCANPQTDISGAILADEPGDQDALANRAIIMRGSCKQPKGQEDSPQEEAEPEEKPAADPGGQPPKLFSSAAAEPAPAKISVSSAGDILQYRCMVCHGCYDAPCQLKLEAHEGLVRGASKQLVYDASRLRAANLTRLFDDAQTEQGWRDKDFYSVLDTSEPEQGVMYRMLALKKAHPLPANGALPEVFDFSLYRNQECPRQDEFDTFARKNPLWGMPYGLPGLSAQEHETLGNWIKAGAREPGLPALDTALQRSLDDWERFLNGDDLKSQLMSRYLYEHLFLASIYLRAEEQPTWFRMVRSATPPGEPLQLIVTRRPYDDPGVNRVYYRLQRMPVTPLAKIHMPYRWDQQRLAFYRKLFLDTGPVPAKLPGYAPQEASNPFRSFVDIPVDSRYRFLLEEAQFSIMNFIKGPVCRGQVALNVINDHFWVMFVDPDMTDPAEDAQFLAREMDNLQLPTPTTGTVVDILRWRQYAKAHENYQRARSREIRTALAQGARLSLESIWDGDGHNTNAALTVFRHFDTASVVRGFVGHTPKTAWVIDYPLLERIHYLLVAGFDVYGAASHQLESRLYMDFLRLEGEFNFLLFMPADKRQEIHDYWYRDAGKGMREHFLKRSGYAQKTHNFNYRTDDPKAEFLGWMTDRIAGARDHRYLYAGAAPASTVKILEELESSVGVHNSYLPHTSILNVVSGGRDEVYTLLRNAGHSNIAQMFREEERRLPEEDSLTVARGFIGAYPNYFFQLNEQELAQFARDVRSLKSEEDYQALLERYGVRRNVSWFWRLSDKLHGMYWLQDHIEYGLLDYNRYLGQ